MVELAAIDERQEDKERSMLKDVLKQLRKEREEEDEARALIEEMRQNLEEAHPRASETERKLCLKFGEYMHSWNQELERPHYVMNDMWRMMQSNDTKTMNLDKDFEELLKKAKQTGWNGSTKTTRFWAEEIEDGP